MTLLALALGGTVTGRACLGLAVRRFCRFVTGLAFGISPNFGEEKSSGSGNLGGTTCTGVDDMATTQRCFAQASPNHNDSQLNWL